MRLALVTWVDAVTDTTDGGELKAKPCLLQEVGFLVDENEDAVMIAMENHETKDVAPGRFKLHIPRRNIRELRVVDLAKAFPGKTVVWRS